MVIYLVYQRFYADLYSGSDDEVYIECAYKSKRKAVKKANEMVKQIQSSMLYIDENIKNKKNPFINNNWVDFYKEETEQEDIMSSIIIEETKLEA